MDKLLEKLGKKFGAEIFEQEGDSDGMGGVIPTGTLSMDVSLGVGGIPRGRVTTIYGAESSGKTTLCLSLANSAIQEGLKVVYIDVEHALEWDYVREVLGEFDPGMFILAHPPTAEEALQLAEVCINGDSKLGIEPGEIGLIVVDSVAALAPMAEQKKELTDSTVALAAKLLTVFFRRNIHRLRKNNTTLVFVNQVRDQVGSYYGGYSLTGGHALKHYSSVIIMMSKSGDIKQGDKIVGISIKFVVRKNKVAHPFRSWDKLPLMFGIEGYQKGINPMRDLVGFAEFMGVLKRRGSFYAYEGEILGKGVVETINYLNEHKEILDKVKDTCYTTISQYKPTNDDTLDEGELDE